LGKVTGRERRRDASVFRGIKGREVSCRGRIKEGQYKTEEAEEVLRKMLGIRMGVFVDGDGEVGDLREISGGGEFETPDLIVDVSAVESANDDQS